MKTRTLIIILSVAVIAFGLRIWFRRAVLTAPVEKRGDFAILVDNSSSQGGLDCAQIATLAQTGLADFKIGKSSRLTVYTLGSEATAYEPVPRLSMVLEKGAGGTRKAMRKVKQACSSFETASGSSIFRAVQVVLNQLQAKGLDGSKFFIQSDLEENIDNRLFQKHGKSGALLNNAGIETTICGVAMINEGKGPRGAHADALVKTWKAAFVAPEQLTVQPFCPGQGTAQASR